MIDVDGKIAKEIKRRANALDTDEVRKIIGERPFILAGGALCGDAVRDFDLYPVHANAWDWRVIETGLAFLKDALVLSRTRNAITVKLPCGQVVQFCMYCKPTLEQLVESFDFAHIQVGVQCDPHPFRVYYTDAFVAANALHTTEYTGSEYPLSSAVRTLKYYKRGRLKRGAAARMMIKAFADVLNRGYRDYCDFKDQLDAVDLGMPDCGEARALYDAMCKAGRVDRT